jgi:integrase
MSVYKRGSIWWIYVTYRGQKIRRSTRRGTTKGAATLLEGRLRASLRKRELDGQLGEAPRHLFDDAIVRWLDGGGRALKSWRQTLSHAARVRTYTAGRWLDEGPAISEELKAAELARGLAPATVNQRLAIIRRTLNLAFDWGWLDTPLGARVRLLPPHNERHLYLTAPEIDALAAAAGPAGDAIRLLAYTGLRLSEAWGLTPAHVVDGCIVLEARTKSGRPRVIPLPAIVADCPVPPAVTRAVFRRRFEQARREIGRPELHAHDLRHSYASMLIASGAEATDVRDLLGHANLAVTSRYVHLHKGRLKAIIENLGHKMGHSRGNGGNGTEG